MQTTLFDRIRTAEIAQTHPQFIPADLPPIDKLIARHLIDNNWKYRGIKSDVEEEEDYTCPLIDWQGDAYGWKIYGAYISDNTIDLFLGIEDVLYHKQVTLGRKQTFENTVVKLCRQLRKYITDYGDYIVNQAKRDILNTTV